MEGSDIVKLIDHAFSIDKTAINDELFINLLREARINPDAIPNQSIKQALSVEHATSNLGSTVNQMESIDQVNPESLLNETNSEFERSNVHNTQGTVDESSSHTSHPSSLPERSPVIKPRQKSISEPKTTPGRQTLKNRMKVKPPPTVSNIIAERRKAAELRKHGNSQSVQGRKNRSSQVGRGLWAHLIDSEISNQ